MHEQQLMNMRMKNDRTLQSQRLDADLKRDARRREYEAQSQDVLIGAKEDELKATQEFEEGESALDRESEEFRTLVSAYLQEQKMYGLSARGWKIKQDQVKTLDMDPDSPTFGQEKISSVYTANREGEASVWNQEGGYMFRGGDKSGFEQAQQQYPYMQDPNIRAEVEADLMNDLGNKKKEEEFERKFGYLPARYMDALAISGDSGLKKYVETNRRPAYVPGNRRGGRDMDSAKQIYDEGGNPNVPTMRIRPDRPEFDEDDPKAFPPLSDAELQQQPTLEEAVPAVASQKADQAERAGMLEEAEAEKEAAKAAQAKAEAEKLEQGGQLDTPAVTGEVTGELTDEDAKSVARAVIDSLVTAGSSTIGAVETSAGAIKRVFGGE
jgi:hypothetical protein